LILSSSYENAHSIRGPTTPRKCQNLDTIRQESVKPGNADYENRDDCGDSKHAMREGVWSCAVQLGFGTGTMMTDSERRVVSNAGNIGIIE
jgi:hypothetical protein